MTNQNDGGKYIPGYHPPGGTMADAEKRQREQAERDRQARNHQQMRDAFNQSSRNIGTKPEPAGCLVIMALLVMIPLGLVTTFALI